jgi:membrane protease YdiL (CAAX protease family)
LTHSLSSRILAIIWSLCLSSLISVFAAGVWTAMISINLNSTPAVPWAIPGMAIVLWLLWKYLGGKGWPSRTSAARHLYLRSNPVSGRVWVWALLASMLSLVALAGLWIVLVELAGTGGNPTIPDYSRFPHLLVILGLLMGSLVSPISEEAAFRGYAQIKLERVFPAGAAILLSSLMFMFWHGPTQGFVWSKLLFYFLVGVAFGTTAYLTNSSLPAIPTHILGDITFFFFIWPHDSARPLVLQTGPDSLFWLRLAQAVVFTILAFFAFRRLANITKGTRSNAQNNSDMGSAAAADLLTNTDPVNR